MNPTQTDTDTQGRQPPAEAPTEAKMLEELSQIDTSPIDDLQRIKSQEDALQGRLDKMEELRGKVSEVVFQRVGEDYKTQYAVLEQEAKPLKGRARNEYAKLLRHHQKLQAAVEAARLDKEELDFRKELGEFTEPQYKERIDSVSRDLKESERHLKECDKLRDSFLEAFHSEEDLLSEAQETDPAPDVRVSGETDSEATAEVVVAPPVSDAAGGATMIIPPARLIVQAGDNSGKEIRLGLQTLSIGRASDAGLRLDVKGVSRRHAEISVAGSGFQIRDSNSRQGLFVNGVQTATRVLEDGDLIELGSSEAQLIFRS